LLNYELFTSRLQNASASGKLSLSFSERFAVARMAKERMGQGPGSMTELVCKALFASVAQSLAMFIRALVIGTPFGAFSGWVQTFGLAFGIFSASSHILVPQSSRVQALAA
jgi:hypothetical protein